ncbi:MULTISPECIES: 7 alpha-hydroxysteroid dehydrogenase [Nitrosomonas]|uniref:7-alpha-hydroxysteroid dehydrogenase n=2 Tax=Nitrosomonas eutropha TaxID=916 RepID=A0ABX5M6J6_9PROT|nr:MULTISPECIES: 7 alpha-hydroxysteroid dehydrogenase [Nitrosomonas]ABI59327.1 short-chain dehydrogenase/reductase SDR [Nitrosomonas eutropha C91]MXS81450.1 SDR family oxidoreductase [Nitrosomonas sp. GH22]PXV72877.1 7-alpha-hydroxysteroid dehydrogenase [Nitrosomonas eutropha]SCX29628.1 7-alpha-hydroxysteroid dehydrogenase [Nitrosomonas eutropha]SDX14707.1 7-alpha-hydroxysteroid dehydrogenase [Nitrosomonas eutropha]
MQPTPLFDLSGKVAIVTGGGNGIGKACARMLADYGAAVVIADLKTEDAQKAADEITSNGGQALAIECNVLRDEDLVRLVERTVSECGGIHILVNNAGGGGAGRESPDQISVEQFAKVFQLNLFSAWRLAQLCAPHMKQAGYGSIITMSSMSSINKSPAISAYASSKAAINHMTANLAFDYGADEIRVNAVGPGAVRTGALASVLTPEIEERMLAHTPLKRLGEPEDIAGAVLYFAAPVSRWVSGQVLFVNGGGVQTLD